ncbi:MAG: SUMF1/EgtB/PvdO family nonheme iron enzyme [Niabella sp.]
MLLFVVGIADAQKAIRLKKLVSKNTAATATVPLQMIEIPTGTFVPGSTTAHLSDSVNEYAKPILISGYYISQTEVTNAQYKEFVNWVRDSIAAKTIGGEYIDVSSANDTSINWKKASKINYTNPEIIGKLSDLFLDPSQTIGQKRMLNPAKLIYLMEGFNYVEASKKENAGRNPNDFLYKYDVQIYPDTLAWMRDFGYSNNEQMAVGYYDSPKYQNYPVVGVSWMQANAFCDWMTKHKINVLQTKSKMAEGGKCRLPTESEWMYAAGLNNGLYSQNTHQQKSKKEKKNSDKKEQKEDGKEKIFPVYVQEGKKGNIGLYNMAENVAEWTGTSYYEGGENFQNRFNPDIQWGTPNSKSAAVRRKVVRGGSWKDTPVLKTTDNRSYEDMGATHSFVGFRIVVNLPQ